MGLLVCFLFACFLWSTCYGSSFQIWYCWLIYWLVDFLWGFFGVHLVFFFFLWERPTEPVGLLPYPPDPSYCVCTFVSPSYSGVDAGIFCIFCVGFWSAGFAIDPDGTVTKLIRHKRQTRKRGKLNYLIVYCASY